MSTALIIVDLQNDFLPGGAMPVKEGDKILPVVNKLLQHPFDFIVATKDWHPADHGSFAEVHGKMPGEHVNLGGVDQILWPVHCVQGSFGAEFSPKWNWSNVGKVFQKGTDKNIDSYSTFFDNGHKKSTGLENYLKSHGITDVYIAGLAMDYCVKYSALDALKLGFNTYVIVDACRAINIKAGDEERALKEIEEAGGKLISSKDISASG